MSDRELLELAAKAAGYCLGRRTDNSNVLMLGADIWNPLQDSGDAFCLMVRLNMEILRSEKSDPHPWVSAVVKNTLIHAAEDLDLNEIGDHETRRAIVRAAAEIGRAMP